MARAVSTGSCAPASDTTLVADARKRNMDVGPEPDTLYLWRAVPVGSLGLRQDQESPAEAALSRTVCPPPRPQLAEVRRNKRMTSCYEPSTACAVHGCHFHGRGGRRRQRLKVCLRTDPPHASTGWRRSTLSNRHWAKRQSRYVQPPERVCRRFLLNLWPAESPLSVASSRSYRRSSGGLHRDSRARPGRDRNRRGSDRGTNGTGPQSRPSARGRSWAVMRFDQRVVATRDSESLLHRAADNQPHRDPASRPQ